MKKITIFGAEGFIGKNLIPRLNKKDFELFTPSRNQKISDMELGDIIYCIGVTSDFKSRPLDTVSAHIGYLLDILKCNSFNNIYYLSSTRVYKNTENTSEDSDLKVNPNYIDDLYNISKIMGENLLLSKFRDKSCIIRLSNVYGFNLNNNFISSIIMDSIKEKEINLLSSLDSEKDYISVENVSEIIVKILLLNYKGIYNLASGKNISNKMIIEKIEEITNCKVILNKNAEKISFPEININKLKAGIDFIPSDIISDMNGLIEQYKDYLGVY